MTYRQKYETELLAVAIRELEELSALDRKGGLFGAEAKTAAATLAHAAEALLVEVDPAGLYSPRVTHRNGELVDRYKTTPAERQLDEGPNGIHTNESQEDRMTTENQQRHTLVAEGRALFDKFIGPLREERKATLTKDVDALLKAAPGALSCLGQAYPLDAGHDKTLRFWTAGDFSRALEAGHLDPSTELDAQEFLAMQGVERFGDAWAERIQTLRRLSLECPVDWCDEGCEWEPQAPEGPGFRRRHSHILFGTDVRAELTATEYADDQGMGDGFTQAKLRLTIPEAIDMDPANARHLAELLTVAAGDLDMARKAEAL